MYVCGSKISLRTLIMIRSCQRVNWSMSLSFPLLCVQSWERKWCALFSFIHAWLGKIENCEWERPSCMRAKRRPCAIACSASSFYSGGIFLDLVCAQKYFKPIKPRREIHDGKKFPEPVWWCAPTKERWANRVSSFFSMHWIWSDKGSCLACVKSKLDKD